MADKERITNPSMGSNELGTETNEDRQTGGLSSGTDTQLYLTAKGGKRHSKKMKLRIIKQERIQKTLSLIFSKLMKRMNKDNNY
jgi:hypothetical protein